MVQYLLAEVIVEMNKQAVAINGDPHGILNPGNLQFLTESIKWKGEKDEEHVLSKAAYLLWYLANPGHIFIEGNKRTTQVATIAFLELNGYELLETPDEEWAAFILDVASGKIGAKAIRTWLKENVKNPEE